jgi:molybdopterin converting factor small subunit
MDVELEVFGALAPVNKRHQILHIDCETTVQQVAESLGLNPDDIGLITIQGVQSELDDVIPPGCRLCLFPPMSGG